MPELLEQSQVTDFDSVEDLKYVLGAKSDYLPVDWYPRDGSKLLGEVEDRLAEYARSPRETTLAYAAGMSAVTDAIEVAVMESPRIKDRQPVVACAFETYSQTKSYINSLRGFGVKVVEFDSGDSQSVNSLIENTRPDVVVTETIGNFVNVPVLDSSNLISKSREAEHKPVLVIDNTLPLSTQLPLEEYIDDQDAVIAVESGTKSYTRNGEMLGIAFTKNDRLHAALLDKRRQRKSLPTGASLELISEQLPEYLDEFDERNLRIYKSTADIALTLAANSDDSFRYVISHPGTATHDNNRLYSRIFSEHASPVFFIQPCNEDRFELAKKLWDHPRVREEASLGASFGFDIARILPDKSANAIRIAGGANTDGAALGEALSEVLYD